MHVELLDRLRCIRPHEDTSLVATASLTVGRQIIEGLLGCPVCHAEYPIRHGAVDYGTPIPAAPAFAGAADDERATRIAALLGCDERGGLYLLDFVSERLAARLIELTPASRVIAISAREDVEGADAVLHGRGEVLPLAAGSLRGIALDRGDPAFLESSVRALAPGGRLIAPADAAVPKGITEIARDALEWVGERDAAERYAILASRRSS